MMQTTDKFPEYLLESSNAERRKYFIAYTVQHPKLTDVFASLQNAVRESSSGNIVFITGSTGSGKTTLRLRTEQSIKTEMLPELQLDPGRLPIIGITAISSETGNFNWKDFFRRLLHEIDEPSLDKKYIPTNSRGHIDTGPRAMGSELRFATEKLLAYRRPVAVFIDDAQHIAKLSTGRRLQDQLDCIKSLVDVTGIPIVMFGTYELLAFRNLSGQLSRRSIDIHLQRYYADIPVDVRSFKSTLWAFQRHLPLREEPDLLSMWDFFYERSIGCVGVLKEWLTKALAQALRDKEQLLKLQHIESTPLSISQCEKMLAEAMEGEGKLKETASARALLRTNLGLPSPVADLQLPQNDSIKIDQSFENRKGRLHPGNRKPTRDTIGRKNESRD